MAFQTYLDRDKSLTNKLWLVKDGRDKVSHPSPQDLDSEYVRTQLFLIADVLNVVGAAQKAEVEKIRDRLLGADVPDARLPLPEVDPANGRPAQQRGASPNLKPWREVIRPRHDVVQGTYSQAEFAADLQQVHDGRAANELRQPGQLLRPDLHDARSPHAPPQRAQEDRGKRRRPRYPDEDRLRRRQDAQPHRPVPPGEARFGARQSGGRPPRRRARP